MPQLDEDIDVEIDPNDLQTEVFLSGGAGVTERTEECHRGTHSPPAHGHHRHLPERTQPGTEPRKRHEGPARSPL